ANEVRAGHQPQDRQGARVDDPAIPAVPRRSGHSVISRRALLGGAVAVLAVPLATKAQQARKVPLVGIVASEATRWSPLRDGLRELGYVEGQNIAFALRVWESRPDRVPDLVGELIQL